MTEWEKAQHGYLYNANYDEEINAARIKCADLCHELNLCKPSETERRNTLIRQILGNITGSFILRHPFIVIMG